MPLDPVAQDPHPSQGLSGPLITVTAHPRLLGPCAVPPRMKRRLSFGLTSLVAL